VAPRRKIRHLARRSNPWEDAIASGPPPKPWITFAPRCPCVVWLDPFARSPDLQTGAWLGGSQRPPRFGRKPRACPLRDAVEGDPGRAGPQHQGPRPERPFSVAGVERGCRLAALHDRDAAKLTVA
jgi:hypothetical protein